MNVRWSHCVLRVRDLDAMADFYCDALGFRVADRGEVGRSTEIVFLSGSSTDHHQLALMQGRTSVEAGSLDHNAFRVDSIDDVKAVHDWVAADDRVGPGFPVTHGNAVSVYFADPEGNGIEVFCDTPWHVRQPQISSWDPTLSADEVLSAVRAEFEAVDGFMPMEQYREQQAEAFGESG
ncbi:MAG: VOC family protein [Ilumatobacter sp.]|uniref:VOC family protein n=1 Tax=Ilumatobacter sp. TaxID=1967498 RepID=UPI002601BAA2|nr:VOC family protein [Ilumatobacter sp.]MDJ0768954.1 VOC family protein [Ilumatobacter sp.]